MNHSPLFSLHQPCSYLVMLTECRWVT